MVGVEGVQRAGRGDLSREIKLPFSFFFVQSVNDEIPSMGLKCSSTSLLGVFQYHRENPRSNLCREISIVMFQQDNFLNLFFVRMPDFISF